MADIATPSAATISTIDAGSEPSQKPQKIKPEKPEKPDEQLYKESLAKAQKEHAASQERVVRLSNLNLPVSNHNPINSQRIGCHQGQDRPSPTSEQGLTLW